MMQEIKRMSDSKLRKEMIACDKQINELRGTQAYLDENGRQVVQPPLFGVDEWGTRAYHAALVREYNQRVGY